MYWVVSKKQTYAGAAEIDNHTARYQRERKTARIDRDVDRRRFNCKAGEKYRYGGR